MKQKNQKLSEKEYLDTLHQKWAKIWPHPSLPREPIYPLGKRPLFEYLDFYADKNPEKDYIIFYGRRVSYKEISELSNKFANFILRRGFQRGDKVALALPNCPQYYIAFFGTHKAGGIVVSLNPMLKEIELEYYFREAKPKFVIVIDSIYELAKKAANKVSPEIDVIPTTFYEFLPEKPEIPPHPSMKSSVEIKDPKFVDLLMSSSASPPKVKVELGDYSTIFFTSGTTGMPKAAPHKHEGVIYTAACCWTYHNVHILVEEYSDREINFEEFNSKLAQDEVSLAVLPIFWVAGHDLGVLLPTIAGGSAVVMSRWDPVSAMMAIEKYKVTSTYLTFDMYWEIIEHPEVGKYNLRSLRTCTGSSFVKGLTKELRKRWREVCGAIVREWAYGMTETHTFDTFTAGFHKNDMDIEKREKYGGIFCGIPVPHTYIKILDENREILPLGEQGEVVIKSPSIISEYLGNPEATKKSFLDGWLLTGDIGMFDEDGFFYYMARRKYMLKVSGVAVFPPYIEYLMLKHPAVEVVGVIGTKDPEKGEVPIAFVKLKDQYKGTITESDLLKWCKENMAPYNVPREIIIKENLPLTTTGKVIREELIKEYSSKK